MLRSVAQEACDGWGRNIMVKAGKVSCPRGQRYNRRAGSSRVGKRLAHEGHCKPLAGPVQAGEKWEGSG